MPDIIGSRLDGAKLAERDAWKRYAEAKGDNWREAYDEWVAARDASMAVWVDEVTPSSRSIYLKANYYASSHATPRKCGSAGYLLKDMPDHRDGDARPRNCPDRK